MGKSGTSHDKKSDKGTQSPMLKIFREMMHRDNISSKDPEHEILLKDKKKKKKKRKIFSHSSSQRHEDDSSANEASKIIQYDGRSRDHSNQMTAPSGQPAYIEANNVENVPENKESWVLFGKYSRTRKKESKESKNSKESKGKDLDDTHSFVSCAFKKIVGNEYISGVALCTLLAIAIYCIFCVLCKQPVFSRADAGMKAGGGESADDSGLDSDGFKMKIEQLSEGAREVGALGRRMDRSAWDKDLLSRLRSNDIGDQNLKSINAGEKTKTPSDELTQILTNSNLNELPDTALMRDFYKKLIKTDARIKRLKRLNFNPKKDIGYYEREKRSIFHRKHRFRSTTHQKSHNSSTEAYKDTEIISHRNFFGKVRGNKNGRQKRFDQTITPEPSGIIFEKKKLLVKFMKDDDVKFPKCSHSNTLYESSSNNHPYAQHTQKLDEILDMLLDQKIPDVLKENPISRVPVPHTNRYETQITRVFEPTVELSSEREETTTPERTTKTVQIATTKLTEPTTKSAVNFIYETTADVYRNYIKPGVNKARSKIKAEILKMLNPQTSSTLTKTTVTTSAPKATEKYQLEFRQPEFRQPAYGGHDKGARSEPTLLPGYDLLLSVSTLINPVEKRVTKLTANEVLGKFPMRKLMQADEEDDEAIGYEDFKEVLSDDMQTHDETDKSAGKKKRHVNQIIAQSQMVQLVPRAMLPPSPKQGVSHTSMPESPESSDEGLTPTLALSLPNPEPNMWPSPLDVHNPNWKGPMPLYQDELSTMIKNAVNQQTSKVAVPVNTKDVPAETGVAESEMNDVQYVEDYLTNKYDKLVKMAQAYSDYGVLTPKKEELRIEKNLIVNPKLDNRVKMLDNDKVYDSDDNLSVSLRSSSGKKERNPFKALANHFKHVKEENSEEIQRKDTIHSRNSDKNFDSTTNANKMKKEDYIIFNTREKRTLESSENNANASMNSLVPKRSLKSVDSDEISEEISLREALGALPTLLNFNGTESGNITKRVTTEESKSAYKFFNGNSVNEKYKSWDDNYTRPQKSASTGTRFLLKSNENVLLEDLIIKNIRKKRSIGEENNVTTTQNYDTNLTVPDKNGYKSTENVTENKDLKSNVTSFDPSEFFLLASNFFSSLSGIFFDKNIQKDPLLNIVALLTARGPNNGSSNLTITNKTKPNDLNIEYPMYDTDMVDNIGHRSRVLLSIEENSGVIDNETETSEDIIRTKGGGSTEVFTTETEFHHVRENSTGLTTEAYIANNSAKTKEEYRITPTYKSEDANILEANKSLVKRSAPEDSNLIFWNDIYDEEYGVQTDPLENTIRDKNSLPGSVMRRPGVWFQDKMKRISDSIKRQSRGGLKMIQEGNNKVRMERDSRGLERFLKKRDYPKYKDTNYDNELFKEKETSTFDSFPKLSEHMKKVCEEAARAVQMTQGMKSDVVSPEARKGEEDLSVNLMKKLVRLLSDLVDYQVQLKTCNRLPPDLHQFLKWLKAPDTASKDEKAEMDEGSRDKFIEILSQTQANPTPEMSFTTTMKREMLPTPSQAWPVDREESISAEDRAEYIGAMHAVQDLLRQYEMMSVEDKNKMHGVKEYLENQLHFLSRQLYPNEYSYSNLYSKIPNLYRLKRDSTTKSKRHAHYKPGRRRYRQRRHNQSNYKPGKVNKFIKSSEKKHTKSTAGDYDNIQLTTGGNKQKANKKTEVGMKDFVVKRGLGVEKDCVKNGRDANKRSLLNVYYQAVEKAKKSTTLKMDKVNDFDN